MKQNQFSIYKRIASFKHAFNGFKILFKEEHNARIHVVATALVIGLSFVLKIDKFEWLVIILCIAIVITAEIFNTVVENICDFISPEKHKMIKRIKDLSAAGVLLTALVSIVVGSVVFIPKILNLV